MRMTSTGPFQDGHSASPMLIVAQARFLAP
jgi:hypothetical protein